MRTLCSVIAQVNCKQAVKLLGSTSCQTVGFSTNQQMPHVLVTVLVWVLRWFIRGETARQEAEMRIYT